MEHPKQDESASDLDNSFERYSENKFLVDSHNEINAPLFSSSEFAHLNLSDKDLSTKLEAMRRYLETVEQKNSELIRSRRKMSRELEQRNREVKFYEKHCANLQNEISVLRNQLDCTTRVFQSNNSTKRSARSYSMIHQLPTNKVPQVLLDVKTMESELEKRNKDISSLKLELDDSKMKVKILQDALSFRSEEIGLAGHADLLAKVAQMKDEVNKLKNELQNKDSQLMKTQENNSLLISEHGSLQELINQSQQKLAQSQKEIHRLANSDVIELLHETEAERNQLVSYIKLDMMKSVDLTQQVEHLEYEVRTLKSRVADKDSQIESLLQIKENYQSESDNLLKASLSFDSERKRMNEKIESLVRDLKSAEKAIAIRTREVEVLKERLEASNNQLNSAQDDLSLATKEKFRLEANVREQEQQLSLASNQCNILTIEIKNLRDENTSLIDRITTCEPKIRTLEPLYSSLLSENKELKARILSMEMHISGMESTEQLVSNLRKDLSELQLSFSNSQEATLVRKGELKEGNKSLAQNHAIWIGLPSLRLLSDDLYGKIRILAQDLHKMETRCLELSAENVRLNQESAQNSELWKESNEYYQKHMESDKAKISSLLQENHQLEKELQREKVAEEVLVHLKSILKFHPALLHPEAFANIFHSAKDSESRTSALTNICDEDIPKIFHQVLIEFAQLINSSTEDRETLKSSRTLSSSLNENIAKYSERCEELESKLRHLEDLLLLKEEKLEEFSSQYNVGLTEASDLVERQNSFIVTLEAKIESLLKDLQQKEYQLQSFHHREYSLRHQVLSRCEKANIPIPMNFAKLEGSFNMNELMNFLFEYLLRGNMDSSSATYESSFNNFNSRPLKEQLNSSSRDRVSQKSEIPFFPLSAQENQLKHSSSSSHLQQRLKIAQSNLLATMDD